MLPRLQAILRIASECFVAAVAAQRHFDVATSQFADKHRRQGGAPAQSDALIQFCPNFIERFAIAALNLWSAAKRPIALHLRLSCVPDQVVSGWQSFDLSDHGLRSRNEAQQQISSERVGVDFPRCEVLIEQWPQ